VPVPTCQSDNIVTTTSKVAGGDVRTDGPAVSPPVTT
jgi:hypothetical protein